MNGEKLMPMQLRNDAEQIERERDWLAERLSSFCARAMLGLPLVGLISREWVSVASDGRSSEFGLEAARQAATER